MARLRGAGVEPYASLGGLFEEELKPVGAKAQRKVVQPADLDLDTPIYIESDLDEDALLEEEVDDEETWQLLKGHTPDKRRPYSVRQGTMAFFRTPFSFMWENSRDTRWQHRMIARLPRRTPPLPRTSTSSRPWWAAAAAAAAAAAGRSTRGSTS